MSIINASPLIAAGDDGYRIERSLRFNSPDTAYLNRTPASAGNRKTWTWSGWVKRGKLATAQALASAPNGGAEDAFAFLSGDTLRWYGNGQASGLTTNAVFRDPSAWYHVVLAMDTTQATASNRTKLYVNGVQQTFTGSDYLAQNTDTMFNATVTQYIGYYANNASFLLDGYLTEINFIDGQALTPSSFGETSLVTGVWGPKRYAGTYGTNGFYLKFADNSNTTAATLGKDSSGNGNNWTPNNFSVTAGVGNDSFIDVPTPYADGGNGRGNYCTLNPLDFVTAAFSGTASNGNLTVSIPAPTNSNGLASTIRITSTAQSKIYIETTIAALSTACSLGMITGVNANYRLRHTADITLAVSDVVMTAFDPATGNIWYGRNGSWLSSGNPATGANPYSTIPSGEIVNSSYCIFATNGSSGTFTTDTNFGQRAFAYTPPTGFLALNTQNLPEPSIKKPSSYFDATIYTGSTGTNNIVNSGGMAPDLVWVKNRQQLYSHYLYDAVRGTGAKALSSNNTNAEGADGTAITSFNSNGFTFTGNSGANDPTYPNANIAWQWKESATPGFDIVTYTGNGTNRTIAHSLGVAPKMMIFKNRTSSTENWAVYHANLANASTTLELNLTGAADGTNATTFNATAPTSSVFSLGVNDRVNKNTNTYVAYLWSEVAGFSKFGSYTGNGSTDGPFVHCGFRPRYIIIKRTSTTGSWSTADTSRSPYNAAGTNTTLWANLADAEGGSLAAMDILSNGFKIRDTDSDKNASGSTYIFAAFAESPFKYSLAR